MPSGVDVDTPVLAVGGAQQPPSAMSMMQTNDHSPRGNANRASTESRDSMQSSGNLRHSSSEEGVEVVLGTSGSTNVVENKMQSQNVFRAPHALQRPRAMRAPSHPHQGGHHYYPPPPAGSWGGYGPPREGYRGPPPQHHMNMPPQHPHHPHGPFPVPPYSGPSASGSFDEQGYHQPHPPTTNAPQFSPHINYQTGANGARGPAGYQGSADDVNVISPNQKTDPNQVSPRRPYYAYPPASPVSRPGQRGQPRLRNYAMRRGGRSAEYDYNYGDKRDGNMHPPLVADSFDSAQQRSQAPPGANSTSASSSPKTATSPSSTPPHHHHQQPQQSPKGPPHVQTMYSAGGSWGSFDSSVQPHFDERAYHGFPPDSPYSPYHVPSVYSPGGLYAVDSFPSPRMSYVNGPPTMPHAFTYSYDDEERTMLRDYHPDNDAGHGGMKHRGRSKNATPVASNRSRQFQDALPKAAEEVDFEVADPPMEPVTMPSTVAMCGSISDVNGYDVLCGRGGGTNSQIGNRRFRQLVQEFQPIYLEAKRKEKPLLARTIVLIIRKRGGRFLKKIDETGEMFEVGDEKAEAKTSQALREGLDVRATRSAANLSKKKKKKSSTAKSPTLDPNDRAHSPPPLPKLHGDESPMSGVVHPHSPDHAELRKRRRMRSQDQRFFNDFMPPRAPIAPGGRTEEDDDGVLENDAAHSSTPVHRNTHTKMEEDSECAPTTGCASIALDLVTGAAQTGFCLGPRGWRR